MVTLWRPHPTGFHPYRKGDIGLSPLDPLCQKRKKAGQSPDGLKNTPRAKARGVFQRSKPSGSSPSWLIPQNIRNYFPFLALAIVCVASVVPAPPEPAGESSCERQAPASWDLWACLWVCIKRVGLLTDRRTRT